METFSSVDLQKRTGDVQRAAARGPVAISVHGKPRSIMLPVEEFERLLASSPPQADSVDTSRINTRIDRFPPALAREIEARGTTAVDRAGRALMALDALGIKAWVIGSLARGTFTNNSDVDFVVDIPSGRKHMVFLILEEAMKDMPFDLVAFDRIDQDGIPLFMEGALDASSFRSRFA